MSFKWCSKSDIGLKRSRNEDYHIVVAEPFQEEKERLGSLFAVADGMGGHPAGDVASRLACEALRRSVYGVSWARSVYLSTLGLVAKEAITSHLAAAFEAANAEVRVYGEKSRNCRGLGTTLSCLLLRWPWAFIAHVGDSRIYRLRQGMLEQLTQDHTFIHDLIEMGEITKEEARRNPMRHVLEQALGEGFQKVYTSCFRLRPGDIFLLCTDGLHDMVPDAVIRDILAEEGPVEDKCGKLVSVALQGGGRDNITVIVVDIGP